MLNKIHLFIIANLFIATSTSSAMEQITEITNPLAAAYLNAQQVAVIGLRGGMIFDAQSRELIHVITTEKVFNITASKDKTWLALSTQAGILFHNIETGKKWRPKDCDHLHIPVAFSSQDNPLFAFWSSQLFSCDYINKQVTKYPLPWNYSPVVSRGSISCHPAKNEFLSLGDDRKLLIAQPGYNPFIKTKLETDFQCVAGDYAPDGHTIALFNPVNAQTNYFICNLDEQKNPLPAHQLIAYNKDYCASMFDPHYCRIFLLSIDGYVHCFDYTKRLLVFATKKLSPAGTRLINDPYERKRLDCDQQGKHIVVALDDTWKVLDVPHKKYFNTILHALHQTQLPKELVKIILSNIIDCYKQSYDYFDLNALLGVAPTKPAICEQPTEDLMTLKTEVKKIQAKYVRPPKPVATNFCINTQRRDTLHNT